MKKTSILIFCILTFLLSFILFHVLGFYLFCKYFGVIGFLWFLSLLSMVYSVLATIWIMDDTTNTVTEKK